MTRGISTRPALTEQNSIRALRILAAGLILVHAAIAAHGDLQARIPGYLAIYGVLLVGTVVAWRLARRIGPKCTPLVLAAALGMRLVAAWGGPALSDDVYRYVWDGRMQVEGVHPYALAPDDPALEVYRDDVWQHINHRELPTVYTPLAEGVFFVLAALGLGPGGFQLAIGVFDFGVVVLLLGLLRARRLPEDRLVLYAWSPFAVVETAGSGHMAPIGVALVLAALLALGADRPVRAGAALGLAIQAKLLPLALVPGFARRLRASALAAVVVAAVLPSLPYAMTGPAIGGGLHAFAERWERNASLYAGVAWAARRLDTGSRLKPWIGRVKDRLGDGVLPYDLLYRSVWPREIAKAIVVALALAWVVWLAFRSGLDPPREALWALGGVLLLAPTVHPWYLLWIAPLAVLVGSPGWLAWVAIVPIAYLDSAGDVPNWVRAVEYGAVGAVLAVEAARTLRTPRPAAGDGRIDRQG